MGMKARRAPALSVDGYIASLGDWRGAVVQALIGVVRSAAPYATVSIKWGQPVFESNGPFAYAQAYSNQVNFGFWRGAELSDPDGRLEGSGAKMRHIKLHSLDEVELEPFEALVREAVELNRLRGNPTR
jgi:hypothetical protein